MAEFVYEDLLPLADDPTAYRLLTTEGVRVVEGPGGRTFLEVDPEALRLLTETAMHDIAHYLRPAHLAQLRRIIDDPDASNNDQFVALDLLKNANIAAGGVLPMCQDTGTAIVMGKRGQHVLSTDDASGDESAIARGVFDAYTRLNLRYSQMAPITTWEEKNTGSNLPAQIELYADTAPGHETSYKFLFMAKGGGSANKSFLYQETKAVLNPQRLLRLPRREAARPGHGGLPALPPRHRHRRHVGRVRPEDSEVREREVPRRAATRGIHLRPRLPRRRARAAGARAHPRASASAPSSAASTSATTSASCGSPATVRRCRSRSRSPAPPTARRWARSPLRASSSRRWRPTRPASCPRPPTSTSATRRPRPTWCGST